MRVKKKIYTMESQTKVLRAFSETLCLIPFSFHFFYWLENEYLMGEVWSAWRKIMVVL